MKDVEDKDKMKRRQRKDDEKKREKVKLVATAKNISHFSTAFHPPLRQAKSVKAIVNATSLQGVRPPTTSVLEMTVNLLMVRLL